MLKNLTGQGTVKLHITLTPQTLQLLRSARRILDVQYPILEAREPSDETAQAVQTEFQAKYPDWTNPARAGAIARTAYMETP